MTDQDFAELAAEGNKKIAQHKFIDVMRILYQVWDGTENANEILFDVCCTFAAKIFDLDPFSQERRDFMQRCDPRTVRDTEIEEGDLP